MCFRLHCGLTAGSAGWCLGAHFAGDSAVLQPHSVIPQPGLPLGYTERGVLSTVLAVQAAESPSERTALLLRVPTVTSVTGLRREACTHAPIIACEVSRRRQRLPRPVKVEDAGSDDDGETTVCSSSTNVSRSPVLHLQGDFTCTHGGLGCWDFLSLALLWSIQDCEVSSKDNTTN